MVLCTRREIPNRQGWTRAATCRVLAGCYETAGPPARLVYVAEQIGIIEGWHYCEWDGAGPVAVKLFVRVND